MLTSATAGFELARRGNGNFRPLLIGLHWPSKPFGDETLGTGSFSGAAGATDLTVETLTRQYARRIADTPRARAALRTIFRAMRDDAAPYELTPELRAALTTLNAETGLGSYGPGARPGEDREPFDPDALYLALGDDFDLGSFGGGLLDAVSMLSFWQMKARAARIGESGAHSLLRQLQAARPGVRYHLMGHSFGCIVVSAMIAGPPGAAGVPVESAVLLQGALSCWAYCADITAQPGQPGYFHRIRSKQLVRGPLVVARSQHDHAVGRFYPIGASMFGQVAMADPGAGKYSALGFVGAQAVEAEPRELQAPGSAYDFQPGRVYNVDASNTIQKGNGPEGAHNDIVYPQIGYLLWAAAAAAP